MSYISGENRGQLALLPAAIEDDVAADAPVRVIDAFVQPPARVKGLRHAFRQIVRLTIKATGRSSTDPPSRRISRAKGVQLICPYLIGPKGLTRKSKPGALVTPQKVLVVMPDTTLARSNLPPGMLDRPGVFSRARSGAVRWKTALRRSSLCVTRRSAASRWTFVFHQSNHSALVLSAAVEQAIEARFIDRWLCRVEVGRGDDA
jgi:hypothetical protein